MKRLTIIVALVLMTMPMLAEHVTPETARKVAETFLQTQTGEKTTLSLIHYEDQTFFDNLYVFGTEHSFVIVSADDCIQPILGYSTENQFGTDKMPDNLFWWLSGYEEQISEAEKAGRKASNKVKQQWDDLISGNMSIQKDNVTEVGPLISTKWNQGSPYNYYCPGGKMTGCVATAMAQIMKYWNYPTTGFGSHSYVPAANPNYGVQTANFGETVYDWANMKDSYNTYNETERHAVAELMYHCGVSVNMNYGESGSSSGALTFSVVHALQSYFNYSNKINYISREDINDDQKWKDTLRKELNENRPIQYRGSKTGGGGHSFVCDGYNSLDKFHFNWGWSGSSDGFYTIDYNYSIGQEAIIGIKPIECNATAPTIVLTKNQRNIMLNWEMVANASSYNVYRNYDLIGNTNSNSFLDSQVPAGNYVYYVRSVDNEGNFSLPSNTMSVEVEFSYTIDDLVVQNLEVSYNGENATLQWTAPINLHYLDFPSFEGDWGSLNIGSNSTFYWGAHFPVSMLDSGLSITSISTYFYTPGTYTAYIYQCTSSTPTGTRIDVTGTYSKGWTTIPIETTINDGQDIWVIFKSVGIVRPTIVGDQNADEGNYYSFNGEKWYHYPYPFFITASLSDGNFTYNLYDNGEIVATDLNTPIQTLPNISSNTAHQYTVKTKLGEQESLVSNMAGVTLGHASLTNLNLGSTDMMIVAPNSCLTITDELVNDKSYNLILENGAQLIHNSENVQATVKKSIEAHGTDDGWYFVASPIASAITPSESNGLLANNSYELYRFNENPVVDPSTGIGKEWENYKMHQNDFNIVNGQGYLYANSNDVALKFIGSINPCSQSISKTIDYHSDAQFAGWNLVGNPFTCNATISDEGGQPKSFYVINGKTVVPNTSNSTTIAPCTGVMVKANGENETIVFTKEDNQLPQTSQLQMTVAQNRITRDGTSTSSVTMDNAIVSFNQGTALEKFVFNADLAKLYIPQGGKDYAIISTEAQGEIPVNFRAAEDGNYTLTIQIQGFETNYLHLVDNMTGINVDLLVTPNYTFEAKKTDYESRFKLVFAPICEDADGDNAFAYISDGNIIINNEDGATIQIVDMTGHVVFDGDAINRVSTSEMAHGVYVLRLINGEKVKTQKIVIE